MTQDQTAMDELKLDGEWCFGVNCESDLEFQDVVRWCHEVYGNVAIKGSYSKDMYITKLVGLRGASLTISDQLIDFNNNTISYERWHQIVNPKNDAAEPKHDPINHPSHYTNHPSGVECIQITRHMTFNSGNVIKYLWRNGLKAGEPSIKDLKKAAWYLNDEIAKLELEQGTQGAPEK